MNPFPLQDCIKSNTILIVKITYTAFLFGMTGAAMGLWKNVMIIYISFMIAFVVALYLIILRKKNKETAFPFAPCIGLAYFLVLAAG